LVLLHPLLQERAGGQGRWSLRPVRQTCVLTHHSARRRNRCHRRKGSKESFELTDT